MFGINVRLARESIKTYKLRSSLTMLGVIVGVAAVITTISIGQGVKDQVDGEVNRFGEDLIIIQPGRKDSRNQLFNFDSLQNTFMTSLSQEDYLTTKQTDEVQLSAPLTGVSGTISYDNNTLNDAQVIGTSPDLSKLLDIEMEYGQFLKEDQVGKNFIVIGSEIASKFFETEIPIGRTIKFQDNEVIILGVMRRFEGGAFAPGVNYDDTVFISQQKALEIAGQNTPIFKIIAKPDAGSNQQYIITRIEKRIEKTHNGQRDFSVLSQADAVDVSNNILTIITSLVGVIAVVALLIGGIGIMNVMLVSVTERTHEIGVRKAVGATNRQIMMQFLIEAILLSVVGCIIGIIIAGSANVFMRIVTDIKPSVAPKIYFAAIGVALLTGIIFGVTPAIKAARKDPIAALRNQ